MIQNNIIKHIESVFDYIIEVFEYIWLRTIPLYGDLNLTPSSIISAKCNRETIWKPPESVNNALFQFMNLCNPPALRKISAP
jgi:hypothetical protein